MMLETSPSCWSPLIRTSISTTLLKFWHKAPLKKLRNISLRLRRGSWRFRSRMRGFYPLKLVSWSLKTLWFERVAHSCNCTGICEETLTEIQRALSRQTLMFLFFRISSGAHASPHTMFEIEYDNPDDPPTVQGKFFLLKLRCKYIFY